MTAVTLAVVVTVAELVVIMLLLREGLAVANAGVATTVEANSDGLLTKVLNTTGSFTIEFPVPSCSNKTL